jgi:hypothetical protein
MHSVSGTMGNPAFLCALTALLRYLLMGCGGVWCPVIAPVVVVDAQCAWDDGQPRVLCALLR